MNIITLKQAMRSNGGADPANCSTLKHAFVPYSKRSTFTDYITGLHKTSVFTSHGDGYSAAATAGGAAMTAGTVSAPGAANFCLHAVGKITHLSFGDLISNGGVDIGATGYIKSSIGTIRTIVSDIDAGVDHGYTLSRLGTASLEARRDGAVTATAALDPGTISAIDADMGLTATEFYGAFLFVFSGAVPANYATVLHELTTRLLAGDYRLPIEIEAWT